jgi:hypothetical protein
VTFTWPACLSGNVGEAFVDNEYDTSRERTGLYKIDAINCPTTLQFGDTCSVRIDFLQPPAGEKYEGDLFIPVNDGQPNPALDQVYLWTS